MKVTPATRAMLTPKICKVDLCHSPAGTRGMCTKHYQRWLLHGDPHHGESVPLTDSALALMANATVERGPDKGKPTLVARLAGELLAARKPG